ncbi:hypothetical protein ACFVU2_19710 [Leifsonia sp. NPDC058194]|uniref:hypothetical protein n=1 Tax=Leifsonia sp. NPDC058194 TaxID=3346374 RepID=UPI0036D86671
MKVIALIVAVLAIVVAALSWTVAWENTHTTMTCKVDSKDRTTKSDNSSIVRIYTTDCGVLTVADDTFQGRFNSADVYSSIQPGRTYTFKTVGWRNGFFSDFPNITDAKAH